MVMVMVMSDNRCDLNDLSGVKARQTSLQLLMDRRSQQHQGSDFIVAGIINQLENWISQNIISWNNDQRNCISRRLTSVFVEVGGGC